MLLGTLELGCTEGCPGVFESAMDADASASCTPKGQADGIEGTRLQEPHAAVAGSESPPWAYCL